MDENKLAVFKSLLRCDPKDAGPEGLTLMGIAYIISKLEQHPVIPDMVQDVLAFHEKFGIDYKGPVREIPADDKLFRMDRITEEHDEYVEAVLNHDLEKQLDALVDLVYITLGTAHLHGWDFNEAWRRVHAKNMAKRRAEPGEGKYQGGGSTVCDIVKPDGWTPPDHSDLVAIPQLDMTVGESAPLQQ